MRAQFSTRWGFVVGCLPVLLASPHAGADVVRLKDGMTLQGMVDKDGTMVDIFDHENLKQTVIRDSKIAETRSETAPKAERFALVQPITVHAGEMPKVAHAIEATPWDELGRRSFSYVGSRSGKATRMTQAINVLGPFAVRYRGIDGFWVGGEATSKVPKSVVLGLLARVDRTNQDERLRVGRFLIQAEWYPEARAELDRLEKDFPDLKERIETVRALVLESEAQQFFRELERRRVAQQPLEVERRLRDFPTTGAPADLLVEVRNQIRINQARAQEDRALASRLQQAGDALSSDERASIEPYLIELLRELKQVPEVARERLEAFQNAAAELAPDARLALALSGWIVGPDRAVPDLASARALWDARDLMHANLATTDADDASRADSLQRLRDLRRLDPTHLAQGQAPLDLATYAAISDRMRPPLHDDRLTPEKVRTVRVFDDPNPDQPSEYAFWLPPEYHPLRNYPALIVLHANESPAQALAPWISEASRRGYVLIAPEWVVGDGTEYHYSANEHAAVLLALHDALRRFAIDADRVFVTGTLEGGSMAWDFALAHPDMLAGASVLSGLPGKYVWPYRPNLSNLPLYLVEGSLAPSEGQLIFEQWAKPQIQRNFDVMYNRYFNRGFEPFPEEIPTIFDWMSTRTRVAAPRQFEAVTAREGDDRFFGVIVKEFAPGRAVNPEGADALGRNIKPAEIKVRANAVLNKLTVDTTGLAAFDVWLSSQVLDFDKKVELQVNGKSVFKQIPDQTDPADYLRDLRIRGDRRQPYAIKVVVGPGGRTGRR